MTSIQLQFSRSSATEASAQITIGTLAAGYRPAYYVGGGGTAWAASAGNNGIMYARNITGASIAAGTAHSVGLTYVLA